MKQENDYTINLYAVKQSVYECEYELDNDFFKSLDQQEILGGNVHAQVQLNALRGRFLLRLHVEGEVRVLCDRCLDEMLQHVKGEEELPVELTNDTADADIVQVDPETGMLDLSWLLYELTEISLPIVCRHQSGECNPQMEELLRTHLCTNTEDPEE